MRSAELIQAAQPVACCGEISGKGGRREIAQRGMRTPLVVIVDLVRDLCPGMIEAEEQALVEKLVAHAPVEALAKAVLHRLSRRNEMPDDRVVVRPGQHGVRGKFGAGGRRRSCLACRAVRSASSIPAPRVGLRSRCRGSSPGTPASRRRRCSERRTAGCRQAGHGRNPPTSERSAWIRPGSAPAIPQRASEPVACAA